MALKLQEHDVRIYYRPGETNGNADGLSRQAWETPDSEPVDVPFGFSTSSRGRSSVGVDDRPQEKAKDSTPAKKKIPEEDEREHKTLHQLTHYIYQLVD